MTAQIHSQYEIPALPGMDTPYRRTVIVPDIASFWNSPLHRNEWSLQGVQDVMRWCVLPVQDNASAPVLVVGARNILTEQYMYYHFKGPWNAWYATHVETTRQPLHFSIHHNTGKSGSPTTQFGHTGPEACARFYGSEIWNDSAAVNPWLELFVDGLPGILHEWDVLDEPYPMLHYFQAGHHGTDVKHDDHTPEEVVILTGNTGQLEARAFLVPRYDGPTFWLPRGNTEE